MAEHTDVLVVGAGHAGANAAMMLRQRGFEGRIVLLGDEPELPYERPPLSKDYLAGGKAFERLLIRPAAFWAERRIELVGGRRVVSVDAEAHEAVCDDGRTIGYGQLVWAAGGRPRTLACNGHDLRGVHGVRTRADVDRLRDELDVGTPRVVVVGGGYIGLECAAVLRTLGKPVVVLEAQDRLLARVAGALLADFYAHEHRAKGVDVRLGVQVECIEGHAGRATGVRLSSGERLPAEIVVVGIGIVPAVEPLLAAGAEGGNGVAVDAECRTTLPDVFAIGDCALHRNLWAGEAPIRLESVQNAVDMAGTVARAITGQPQVPAGLPWFWSTQYDLRLQTAGLATGHDDTRLVGDPASRSFAVVYLRNGVVAALDGVNATPLFAKGRALVQQRAGWTDGLLGPDFP